MPASTLFWFFVPPFVLLIAGTVHFVRAGRRDTDEGNTLTSPGDDSSSHGRRRS